MAPCTPGAARWGWSRAALRRWWAPWPGAWVLTTWRNRLQVADGVLTGRVLGRVVDRGVKERCLRAWAARHRVPLERTLAVGDGANDLDMLRAAGLGVAFCAKPVVDRAARAAVRVRDLAAVLELIGAR